ncbi:conserved exported hypothetical protein [uncultured delta proteobacterium]|uniref:Uncharacterized protein n=1 Tax=uncultured delta proteobacterium TaxID=34034 RepID=A0A212IX51_9DELT|nr:conserved exported hypothetical protein [uncultured delta proteobacterium]
MHTKEFFRNKHYTDIPVASKDRRCTLRASILSIILCSLLLIGCAGNIVNLSYPPLQKAAAPGAAKNISVCVVDFANKRQESAAIGKRLNDDPILPRTPVERWLATGLALELENAGYTVIMAETLPAALMRGADYIVAGEVEEVWLAEVSYTRFTGTIRASISLLDGKGDHITRNAYNSVYSKTILPIYGVPQSLLDEALAEMLLPAVRLLAKTMQ